ncbi:MAG: hypothetical protein Q9P01_06595, partial [Anaerolineae bacterium]|nr:hypothetical protein [Anaerolineae bacterium]
MQKIWRGLLVVVVLLIASASVAAIDTQQLTPHFFESTSDLDPVFNQTQPSTSADVIIVPREGEQGDSHQIAVGGLQANELITIRIVQDSTATRVYNTSRNASDNGRVQIDIFTTSDDAPGNYTIEIVNTSGTVIGTGSFVILETSGFDGTLNITPPSATAGSSYTIDISNVRAFLDMEVVVLNEIDERVFVTQVRSSVDGLATVQFTSTPRDGGTYTVVVRAADTQVASGILIVDGPCGACQKQAL